MEEETSKNEYFLKKEEKDKEIKRRESKQKTRKIFRWGLVLILASAAVWGASKLLKGGPVSTTPINVQFFPAQSHNHIATGEAHPNYNSNPPTGGWHYNQPAAAGIYDTELPDEQVVHNLEHGHVWISYRPALDKDSVNKIADIAISYSSKIIVTPRAKNDSLIAVAAWEHLMKLDSFQGDKILAFIKQFRNKGPEMIPMGEPPFGDFRKK